MCTERQAGHRHARAAQAGIVDAVIDGDLLDGAIAFATARAAAGERRTHPRSPGQDRRSRRGHGRLPGRRARRSARPRAAPARRSRRWTPSRPCLTMDFDAGSRRERELFADCVLSTESKAMRHLFFAEREAAKIPDVPKGHAHARRSRAPPSSAPAPWAAASPWRTPMPASRFCSRTSIRPRSTAAWPSIRKNYESTVAKGRMTPEAHGEDAGAHHADDDLRRLRSTSTSSSRPCSRTWT